MTGDGPGLVRLTRHVLPWFEAAFRAHALGERVTWEITFAFAQTEQGPVPQLLVYAQLPAATLGQVHWIAAQLAVFGLVEAQVDREIAAMVAKLLEMRSGALAQANGAAPAAGLIVPGGPA